MFRKETQTNVAEEGLKINLKELKRPSLEVAVVNSLIYKDYMSNSKIKQRLSSNTFSDDQIIP